MKLMHAAGLMTSLAMSVTTAFAAEPYVGRWNTTAKECRSEALFTFTPKNIEALTFACETTSFKKDATGWAAHGRKCSSEDDSEKPADMDFHIASDGKTLQIDWLDGTKSDKLVRCGK